MKPLLTTIQLTEHEAKMFLTYQKYHDVFEKLTETHALDMEFGKVTINIAFNEIQNIVQERMVYRNK